MAPQGGAVPSEYRSSERQRVGADRRRIKAVPAGAQGYDSESEFEKTGAGRRGCASPDERWLLMPAVSPIFPGISIIDTDTHWSEPPDLWTSLAPAKYKELVPQIREHNGRRKWVVNRDVPLAGDSAVSAIGPDGEKMLGLQFLKKDIEMVH